MAVSLSGNPPVLTSGDEVAYPEHLTGTFTGGFGEETCRSCHFDYDLNPDEGNLSVLGIPDQISGGEKVDITVVVKREELGRAGFQLSARYESGRQAGSFETGDNKRIIFSEAVPDTLQYVQHSRNGSTVGDDGKNSWTITWEAPGSLKEPVIFNVSANAANGDQSEFGDFIYAEEIKVRSSGD